MAINLYLDTNVYLSFFHLSNDDLEELEKLLALVKTKEILLCLPQQTKDEFIRNRDVKIADAINRFKENKLNGVFPQICKDYDVEYKAMREAIRVFEKNKQKIIENLGKDIAANTLKADKIINELFKNAKFKPTTDEVYNRAKRRYDLGNPPGKKNSIGDGINWEVLLDSDDNFEVFYFISDDRDYYSEYNVDIFNSFLLDEWQKNKFGSLSYYRKLSSFFKDRYPNIIIASEYEKDSLITQLQFSSSFSTTRDVLRKLNTYDNYSVSQLNDIANAAISNNQIYWIAIDSDICEMLNSLILNNKTNIEQVVLNEYLKLYPY